jgi:hypothetical protein
VPVTFQKWFVSDLVQHVIANATDANLQRRAKLSIHDISDEDKLDAEARLFYLFEESLWTKKRAAKCPSVGL